MTEEEYLSNTEEMNGVCLCCGAIKEGVEPDAEDYECDECEQMKVFGIEQALLCDFLIIK